MADNSSAWEAYLWRLIPTDIIEGDDYQYHLRLRVPKHPDAAGYDVSATLWHRPLAGHTWRNAGHSRWRKLCDVPPDITTTDSAMLWRAGCKDPVAGYPTAPVGPNRPGDVARAHNPSKAVRRGHYFYRLSRDQPGVLEHHPDHGRLWRDMHPARWRKLCDVPPFLRRTVQALAWLDSFTPAERAEQMGLPDEHHAYPFATVDRARYPFDPERAAQWASPPSGPLDGEELL